MNRNTKASKELLSSLHRSEYNKGAYINPYVYKKLYNIYNELLLDDRLILILDIFENNNESSNEIYKSYSHYYFKYYN